MPLPLKDFTFKLPELRSLFCKVVTQMGYTTKSEGVFAKHQFSNVQLSSWRVVLFYARIVMEMTGCQRSTWTLIMPQHNLILQVSNPGTETLSDSFNYTAEQLPDWKLDTFLHKTLNNALYPILFCFIIWPNLHPFIHSFTGQTSIAFPLRVKYYKKLSRIMEEKIKIECGI